MFSPGAADTVLQGRSKSLELLSGIIRLHSSSILHSVVPSNHSSSEGTFFVFHCLIKHILLVPAESFFLYGIPKRQQRQGDIVC
ncbi:hypothetical protein BDW67DRAFT_167698 [Aspergillus spinulosporus]